ncbi:hypothetical protein X777_02482 [Ooceraea biroi]|nr:hypothetical protein X777_02482 [Ooceraea biroi]
MGAGIIINGILFTLWLHSFGIFCNNLVGYIYLKQDNSRIILSYVNYWGKRTDLESPVNDVIPMSDNPRRITDFLFKKITFLSRKETLKLNMKFGLITHDNFKYILGTH